MDSVQSPAADEGAAAAAPPAEATALKQGTVVGGRFVIDEHVHADVHGSIYRAVDEKTGKSIAILMLDPGMVGDREVSDELRSTVRVATEIRHKNLLGVFGMGKEGGQRYVARDFVDGQTLAELLDKKASAGKQFTLKGAYNLIAHVCNGLQYARPQMEHGTLRPSVVLINRLGRVKLADMGFARLRAGFVARRDALNRWDRPCFPDPDGVPADDLHVLGILLYSLLVGTPPESADVAAEARARLPDGLGDVIARCLVGSPERFDGPTDLRGELLRAVEGVRAGERSGVGPSPSVDMPAPSAPPAAGPPPAAEEDEVASADGEKADKGAGGGFVIPELGPSPGSEDDGTVQRWLMERDGIDYGPFTGKQIVEKLFKEELTAETVLFDIESDRRLPMSEFDAFDEAILAWVHEKDKREKERQEEAERAASRRRTRIVLGTLLFLLVTVGGGFGGWFYYQSTLPQPIRANLAALVTPIKIGLPSVSLPEELPETAAEIRERRDKERKARLAKASAAERARILREERLAASSNLDAAGGTGKFDRAAFDKAVAGRQSKTFRCLQNEVRRDPKLKSLTIEITVIPSGELINVKMPAGSSRGQSCVRQALRGLRVPGFAGSNVKVKLPFQFQ